MKKSLTKDQEEIIAKILYSDIKGSWKCLDDHGFLDLSTLDNTVRAGLEFEQLIRIEIVAYLCSRWEV